MNSSKTRLLLLLVGVSLAGYLIVFMTVYSGILIGADTETFLVINRLSSSTIVASLAIIVTFFGDEIVLIILALLLFFFNRKTTHRGNSIGAIVALIIADLTVFLLKTAYFRPRPFETLNGVILPLAEDTQSSFPSGHVTRAFAVTVFLAWKNPRWWSLSMVILAGGVAISRVLLGVHYPLDVVGGGFLGTLIALVTIVILPRVEGGLSKVIGPSPESKSSNED